jgi:Transposase DDE domain
MRTKTPFLPGFPTLLFGRAKRSAQAILRSRQLEIRSKLCGEIALEFADEVPSERIEADSRTQRERVYSNRVTFWAFLSQVFSEDGSCAAAVAYPAEEIASLYHHRCEIELRFRDIKTTMGMEMLRTQSPKMLRKEIMMHMIAYNLIKLLM